MKDPIEESSRKEENSYSSNHLCSSRIQSRKNAILLVEKDSTQMNAREIAQKLNTTNSCMQSRKQRSLSKSLQERMYEIECRERQGAHAYQLSIQSSERGAPSWLE